MVESEPPRCHDGGMRDVWIGGYKADELAEAQERYGLCFPPDLIDLLLDRRPVDWWDWRSDDQGIRSALKRPLEGLLFDLENNDLWWPEWGERPASAAGRAAILTSIVNAAPRLIPLYSHRYIPETPQEAGNPVFSIMQSDVIYYGANLTDYIANEIGRLQPVGPVRNIPFWSELVSRSCWAE